MMVSDYSTYRSMIITLIFLITLVFSCYGEKSVSLSHFCLTDKNITSAQFYSMIEDNESIDLNNNNSLSLNVRIISLLHCIWFCRETNEGSGYFLETVVASDYIIFLFESYYWLEPAIDLGRQAYVARITQVYQFKKYLIELKTCMEAITSEDNQCIYVCILNYYLKFIQFRVLGRISDIDELNNKYKTTKKCIINSLPNRFISRVHTCLKLFNDVTYKFEVEYNKKVVEIQKDLRIQNPIVPKFHGTSEETKKIPVEVYWPHGMLKDRVVSPDNIFTIIQENDQINLKDDSNLSVSYRIVELLHYMWFYTVLRQPLSENVKNEKFVTFFEAYYWLDDSFAKSKLNNDGQSEYQARLKQVAPFKANILQLKTCLREFFQLHGCIFENYFQYIGILTYSYFMNFYVLSKRYENTKICMINRLPIELIKDVHACYSQFNRSTKSDETDYNKKLVQLQKDLAFENIIYPRIHE